MNLDTYKNGFHISSKDLFDINEKVKNEFENVFQKEKFQSEYLNTSIIENIDDIMNYPEIYRIFGEIINILKKNNYYNKIKFDDIWFIKSTQQIFKSGQLPYIPHIDKVRKFKVMIYLNDVDIEDGPINFIKIDPEKFENFRKNLKSDYKTRQENLIKDYPLGEYEPVSGLFGTTIFFDTNTPHFAGKLEKNFATRKAIRFNFRYFEKKNKIKLILAKLSKLFSN